MLGRVAAVIGQGPGTGNDLFSFTCSGGYNIRIGCIQGGIAVVGFIGYIAGYRYIGVISAGCIFVNCNVCRGSKCRGSIVLCRNYLYMLGRVATVISQGPGTGNDLFSFTCTGGYYIRIGCIQGGIAVVSFIGYIAGYCNSEAL